MWCYLTIEWVYVWWNAAEGVGSQPISCRSHIQVCVRKTNISDLVSLPSKNTFKWLIAWLSICATETNFRWKRMLERQKCSHTFIAIIFREMLQCNKGIYLFLSIMFWSFQSNVINTHTKWFEMEKNNEKNRNATKNILWNFWRSLRCSMKIGSLVFVCLVYWKIAGIVYCLMAYPLPGCLYQIVCPVHNR